MLLGLAHRRLELLARLVRASTIGGSPPPVVARDRPPAELALEELDPRAGELVERLAGLARRHARVGDQQDPVLHVIEGQHRVEQHEGRFVGRIAEARRVGSQTPSTAGSNHGAAS